MSNIAGRIVPLAVALVMLSSTAVAAPTVATLVFDPPIVTVGTSSTGRFGGTDLTDATYFDVRFRRPGGTADEVAFNWQQGNAVSHSIPSNTAPGNWVVNGIRAHQNVDDHAGAFDSVPATLSVAPTTCVVKTTSGDLYGVDFGASCAFLGVPYAAPPMGSLRWKPPQRAASWLGIFNATNPVPNCPGFSAANQPQGSEDCLALNIWVPKPVASNTAVMVWFHPGAFVAASANNVNHNGRKLAEQKGIIVVAPNYRLGPFGFLAHAALTNETSDYRSSGNYGFLDQRAALVWVRENIATFGGDPGNVTIGGQSAGGTSVSMHIVSSGSAGLFHRAMMHSGYASSLQPTRPEAELQGNDFAIALGCTDASQVLACMRGKTRDQVLRALPIGSEGFVETPTVKWGPIVDGVDIPDQPRNLYERGAFNRVPTIIGATRDDGWVFVDRSFPSAITAAQYDAAVRNEFGNSTAAILARYPLQAFGSPKDALAQITGDVEFICEAVRVAKLIERTGAPVYLFSFDFVIDGVAANRAIHGLDLNFVFGNDFTGNPVTHVLNNTDLELFSQTSGYWTRFATTGNPNGSAGNAVNWPLFDHRPAPGRETDKYLILNSVIRGSSGLRQPQCDFLEPFFFRSLVGGSVTATTP